MAKISLVLIVCCYFSGSWCPPSNPYPYAGGSYCCKQEINEEVLESFCNETNSIECPNQVSPCRLTLEKERDVGMSVFNLNLCIIQNFIHFFLINRTMSVSKNRMGGLNQSQ